MYKLIIVIATLSLGLLPLIAEGNECDISGIWQHSAKPATLFIDLNKAEMSVHTHQITPESIGKVVITSIKLDANSKLWRAKMYSAAENSFVNVQIKAQSCDKLKVSYDEEDVLTLLR